MNTRNRWTIPFFALFFFGGIALGMLIPPQRAVSVDAVVTVNTPSKIIKLVDETGKEVGSVEFDDKATRAITLTIARRQHDR